jgi:type IV pilus assembly protein PilO
MPSNSRIAAIKDPRVIMRAVIGVLLAANLAAAVMAFHPFGGSAEDLRREQEQLSSQLTQSGARLSMSRRLVDKVQNARAQGDKFMGQYFMDVDKAAAVIVEELERMRNEAGIKMGQASFNSEQIEGSDSLYLLSIQVGFEGTYANFAKFVNLLDKSPRFLVIENLTAAAPQAQGGQSLNVTLKIDAFIRDTSGAA